MRKRTLLYIVIAFDLLYVIALAAFPLVFRTPRSPDLAAIRSRVEASSSFEDLRPRTFSVISAFEASDRVAGDLRRAITHLIRLSIALMLVNVVAFYIFVPRAVRI